MIWLTAENGADALKAVQAEIFDLVITDVKMPGVDGMEVLKTVKEVSPETVVIMITAFATTETAVEAMKLGAYDYITKPFKVDEIKLIIQKALEKRHLRKENILLQTRDRVTSRVRKLYRKERTHAEGVFSHPAGCGYQEHRAHNGRERNRKRARSEGHSLQQLAKETALL